MGSAIPPDPTVRPRRAAGRRRYGRARRPASAGRPRPAARRAPRAPATPPARCRRPPALHHRGQLGAGLLVAELLVLRPGHRLSCLSRRRWRSARPRRGGPAAGRPWRPRPPRGRRGRRRAARSRSRAPAWRPGTARAAGPACAAGRRSAPPSRCSRHRPARSRSAATSAARWSTITCGRASTGRERSSVEPVLLPVDQVTNRPVQPVPGLPDQADLLGQVRHDPLGRVGRGGGAHVGDVVEQRRVGLVADRADHRRAAGEDRPAQRLVGEGQQILDAAAAPGDDDHVDRRVARRAP